MVYVSIFECWVLNRLPPVLGDEPIVLDRAKTEVSLGSGEDNGEVRPEQGFSSRHCKFVR